MVLLFKIKIEPFFGGVYPEKIQWLLKLTTIYYTGGPSGGPLLRLEVIYVRERDREPRERDARPRVNRERKRRRTIYLPYTPNTTGAASALGAVCCVMYVSTDCVGTLCWHGHVWLSGCMQAGRACSLRARQTEALVTEHVSSFSRS